MNTFHRCFQITVALAALAAIAGCPQAPLLPVAQFSADIHIGEAPLEVTFTDLSYVPGAQSKQDGQIDDRLWRFGDGTSADAAVVTHTYTEPGVYSVSLTVTDDQSTSQKFVRHNGIVVLDPDRVTGTEAGEERTVAGIEFVWIPPGTFQMGHDQETYVGDLEYYEEDAQPQHPVTISHGFWMSKYEVRQEDWVAVMGYNPSIWNDLPVSMGYPVDSATWYECKEFIYALNELGVGLFRLPTEAEWEYACRAGTETLYHFGETLEGLNEHVSSSLTSPYSPQPVGTFLPNPWGLYDMHGNLWEWVQDFYLSDYYSPEAKTDPFGPPAGSYKVTRGGSYRDPFFLLTSVTRTGYAPTSAYSFIGLRLVLQ